jgi:hypothetical protein
MDTPPIIPVMAVLKTFVNMEERYRYKINFEGIPQNSSLANSLLPKQISFLVIPHFLPALPPSVQISTAP